ncbi:Trimeric GatFAB AmidoTransferase(AdT) complex subunit [Exophiala dermatitidis]|uniref:Glutamyl-tRNA(Gln) amidotransferase subunit A, mitochondrial n=2 Tax=Exophiala dermatitidis TaxID=5970 RepID=H6C695_EXODN|nr:aspartyl-tRNA(Asn)/glutamyl-tRNA (Gln) amidotransferase subunit A [Exophiala dermatitidis NIH/UT8656]KAJ4526298.1 Trimeric GatFAB AmidoTransferase(AdT) complex subunit [Exophiala dermatitidis]EHY59241.1 aspartyl-tRNA(Asn)/glutamyl-tRNA (Gln) amidotransferase subunit A [Exophiala dermatitidis NIH/UT8656]KAJ4526759.1 Trimeric GatFAB AmidoTransferase(AdT) complex subunit [Exophiala dermatitidis]KAJ4576871.1 Trimeric GatFAB AmidoTransferase(AdT) complex subunit [Exophiala dermatitidis]KAJ459987
MRLDRSHRDWRDIYLKKAAKAILRRSQYSPHYGNPYISVDKSLLRPEYLLGRLKHAERLHRSTVNWNNYNALKSANEGYTAAIKDNILTKQLPTTCASRALRGFCLPQNATLTKLLESAGMIVLGKTNMDEFGMGSHTINSAFGASSNGDPRRPGALSVGGSSGGSALAVAQDLAHIAIGTDTGGSIRLPAAYMSLIGFKPSYGMISRFGVVPYANSLDTVGIIAKSAADIRLTFDILRRPDASDPTCLTAESRKRIQITKNRRRASVLESNINVTPAFSPRDGIAPPKQRAWARSHFDFQRSFARRIGVPIEYNIAEMHPLVRWAWTATLSHLQMYGFEIVPISLPSTKHALSSYYVLAPAEASSNLAKYDGVRYGAERTRPSDDDAGALYSGYRGDNLGPEVKRRILLGTYSLSAGAMDNYFIQAQKIRRMVQKDFDAVFRMPHPFQDDAPFNKHGVDMIVVPTAPTPPPHVRFLKDASPVESYMNDVFTVPASLAGLPAISVPGPRHPDYPWKAERAVGIQVIGQYGDDFSVIYFAQNFLTNFHNMKTLDRLQHDKMFQESPLTR